MTMKAAPTDSTLLRALFGAGRVGIGTSRTAAGNGTGAEAAGGVAAAAPDAGTRGPKASGGGAREIGAGSDEPSTTGCGPRDGMRENGDDGSPDSAAGRRATATGRVSP